MNSVASYNLDPFVCIIELSFVLWSTELAGIVKQVVWYKICTVGDLCASHE